MKPIVQIILMAAITGSVLAQPNFSVQPQSVSVSLGAEVFFQASARNATTYQWFKDGAEIEGATSFRLRLHDIREQDGGVYELRATDSEGLSAVSHSARLTVDTQFTKIMTGALVEDRNASVGAAWADFDGDGWVDLFVVNMQERNALYRNNGDGTFTRVSTGPLVNDIPTHSHGCAWADVNNNGLLDLFVSNLDTQNYFYFNEGGGEFTKMPALDAGQFLLRSDRSVGIAWADYDLDGWVDLFIPNGGIPGPQADELFRNDRSGGFLRAADGPVTMAHRTSNQGAWADYDNDGDPDLFVTYYDAPNRLFRNDGQGRFEEVSGTPLTEEFNNSFGAAWGDYDNNGFPDLFVTARIFSGLRRNSLFRNLGGGEFEQILDGEIVENGAGFWHCSWVDYDNDGHLDLFVSTDQRSSNFLYRNNGDGSFTRLSEGSLVNDVAFSVGAVWADYNDDGFPDLFVANGALAGPAQNFLYRNNGNENGWIKVRCVGTLSNRSAIGTKIRVKARIGGREVWQLREISSGSGYLSQESLEQIIGLGDAAQVDLLRVEWPSGVVQELRDLPIKQTLHLVEPLEIAAISWQEQAVTLRLAGRTSRLFQIEASTDLRTWAALGRMAPEQGVLRLPEAEAEAAALPVRFYRLRVP